LDQQAFDKYVSGRFAQMLKFYDDRSAANKAGYRALSVFTIVASAGLVPLLAFAPPTYRLFETLVSSSLVMATALLGHFKFHENWLSFRASWDAMRREEQYHHACIHDYKSHPDPNALFVERVEAIMAREGAEFFMRHEHADKQSVSDKKKKQ
jgi:hypothetical protein